MNCYCLLRACFLSLLLQVDLWSLDLSVCLRALGALWEGLVLVLQEETNRNVMIQQRNAMWTRNRCGCLYNSNHIGEFWVQVRRAQGKSWVQVRSLVVAAVVVGRHRALDLPFRLRQVADHGCSFWVWMPLVQTPKELQSFLHLRWAHGFKHLIKPNEFQWFWIIPLVSCMTLVEKPKEFHMNCVHPNTIFNWNI